MPRFVCFRAIFFLVCLDLMRCLFVLGRFQRGLKRKPMALIKKLRKAVGVSFTFALSLVVNCVMRGLCRSACACTEL